MDKKVIILHIRFNRSYYFASYFLTSQKKFIIKTKLFVFDSSLGIIISIIICSNFWHVFYHIKKKHHTEKILQREET